ncbi:MAG: hypothetical protein ABIK28_12610, partial [Planctomycetota bacterium]
DLAGIAMLVNRLGEEFGCHVLPIFQKFSSVVATGKTKGWYTDFCHPYFHGHTLIALTLAEYLGFKFSALPI